MPAHAKKLQAPLEELRASLEDFRIDQDLEELIRIIRHPGWTTPAELLFTGGYLRNMNAQIQLLKGMSAGLLEAARAVRVER